MKITSMIAATAAPLLIAFTLGCGPPAPTNVSVDTSSTGSNTTGDGGNVTAGTDTPITETP